MPASELSLRLPFRALAGPRLPVPTTARWWVAQVAAAASPWVPQLSDRWDIQTEPARLADSHHRAREDDIAGDAKGY
jgi:hypothetical protein